MDFVLREILKNQIPVNRDLPGNFKISSNINIWVTFVPTLKKNLGSTSSNINRLRHVFVFIINDANIDSQTENIFLYNTFSVSTDSRTLSDRHLEVGWKRIS